MNGETTVAAPAVVPATPQDQDRLVSVIVLAFACDPFARWVWPEAADYAANAGPLTRAFGGRGFAHGSVNRTGDFSGAALWLPPGVQPDEAAIVAIVDGSVQLKTIPALMAVLEEMGRHRPTEPHWYLPTIGVDPAYQGRGHGSALLRYALERIDREHAIAYLENTNPRNTPLYERHGFETVGTIQADDSPPLLAMLRPAR